MKSPTDFQILDDIYENYYKEFSAYVDEAPGRAAKIYVPIDIPAVARRLGVDPDIVFGRLYYYLQEKHGYTNDDGAQVPFFARRIGQDRDCVNFPLLSAIHSGMRAERRKDVWAIGIAVVSLVISILSLGVSMAGVVK